MTYLEVFKIHLYTVQQDLKLLACFVYYLHIFPNCESNTLAAFYIL
jgi:hypothetical protein